MMEIIRNGNRIERKDDKYVKVNCIAIGCFLPFLEENKSWNEADRSSREISAQLEEKGVGFI